MDRGKVFTWRSNLQISLVSMLKYKEALSGDRARVLFVHSLLVMGYPL